MLLIGHIMETMEQILEGMDKIIVNDYKQFQNKNEIEFKIFHQNEKYLKDSSMLTKLT